MNATFLVLSAFTNCVNSPLPQPTTSLRTVTQFQRYRFYRDTCLSDEIEHCRFFSHTIIQSGSEYLSSILSFPVVQRNDAVVSLLSDTERLPRHARHRLARHRLTCHRLSRHRRLRHRLPRHRLTQRRLTHCRHIRRRLTQHRLTLHKFLRYRAKLRLLALPAVKPAAD